MGKLTVKNSAESIARALSDIALGKPVIVVDDKTRENEGDLIMAAERASEAWVAFFIRHTSGILCTALSAEHARRLNLQPMVAENEAPLSTAFTVSVDLREGLTTGISAQERAATVRALAHPSSRAEDFVRPGHIFPLIAKRGGVLIRSGHTEAALDLAANAGLQPVGLLAELVNDDGSVSKGRSLEKFARKHALTMISIDTLIAWRQKREKLVQRVAEVRTPTAFGVARAFVYETPFDGAHHIALLFGAMPEEEESGERFLVRLHREDVLQDLFASNQGLLQKSMAHIAARGRGVIVYLREGAVGVLPHSLVDHDKEEAERKRSSQWHEIGLGAQILRDLGIRTIRLIGTRERKFVGLKGFGIEISGYERLDSPTLVSATEQSNARTPKRGTRETRRKNAPL